MQLSIPEMNPHAPKAVKCETCGHDFIVKANRKDARFCSTACMGKGMSKSRLGRKNPGWKHGRSEGWNIRGWSLAAKGETRCRSCGSNAVHLHHAIPRGTKESRADLRNGLPLCARCHTRWHAGHPIRREVFKEEEWTYLKSVKMTGRETLGWLDKHYPSASTIKERALVVA